MPRITFTQRTVYILPSKSGVFYTLVVFVLLLGAINEQLNLAYALAFLLGGVGLSSISLTHGNLRGLSLEMGVVSSVHAGQTLQVPVVLDASQLSTGRYGLVFNRKLDCEVEAGQRATILVPVTTDKRGWLDLPRWSIETFYPLGLFRAWGYWQTSSPILVWPALDPEAPAIPGTDVGEEQSDVGLSPQKQNLQDEIREWRRGDAMQSIIWKKSATRMVTGLLPVVRQDSIHELPSYWIDWEMTHGMSVEPRLSRLATWLVRCEEAQQSYYGLRLPGKTIACGKGSAHLSACLDALAIWNSSMGGSS